MSTGIPAADSDKRGRRRNVPRYRRRAWWSLVLLPVSLVLAFVVGEGMPGLLGATIDETTTPPLWVMAVTLVAAAVVFALPLLLTWYFGAKSAAVGEQGAWMPLIVGAAVVGLFVLANVASGVLVLLFG